MSSAMRLLKREEEKYGFSDHDYGKSNVRLLHVEKQGPVHNACELKVSTRLQLSTLKDYISGDNTDVVATDTQKNTIHVLAKKHGIASPEQFALLLARHFLTRYSHVVRAIVSIEEVPWERMTTMEGPHYHAFVLTPRSVHTCTVELKRLESGKVGEPLIRVGLRGLRVLKTTQSKFVDFHQDDFRTLEDAEDRVFATEVTATWIYSTMPTNPKKAWHTILNAIIYQFAGPAKTGLVSPSVQNTLYLAQLDILHQVAQVLSIEITMPNLHYLPLPWDKFRGDADASDQINGDILLPISEPSGLIHAKLERSQVMAKI